MDVAGWDTACARAAAVPCTSMLCTQGVNCCARQRHSLAIQPLRASQGQAYLGKAECGLGQLRRQAASGGGRTAPQRGRPLHPIQNGQRLVAAPLQQGVVLAGVGQHWAGRGGYDPAACCCQLIQALAAPAAQAAPKAAFDAAGP